MTGGVIEIGLLFPIRYVAADTARFPEPVLVTENGSVSLPPNGD
jgi:hypothetical protein